VEEVESPKALGWEKMQGQQKRILDGELEICSKKSHSHTMANKYSVQGLELG
jgi:hypothetical protein